jgi:DNA-binding transcriptional LysR family regulator
MCCRSSSACCWRAATSSTRARSSWRSKAACSIAATHSQARYALPVAVQEFRAQFPNVKLHLHQGSPKQVAQMLLDGEADVGIATEALGDYPQLVALPCYRWTHSVIVPPGHPLLDAGPLTLDALARFRSSPTTPASPAARASTRPSSSAGLQPNIVLAAMDADVIKTYVQLGLGVGIVAAMAYEAERDTQLRAHGRGAAVRHQPDQAGGAPRHLPAQATCTPSSSRSRPRSRARWWRRRWMASTPQQQQQQTRAALKAADAAERRERLRRASPPRWSCCRAARPTASTTPTSTRTSPLTGSSGTAAGLRLTITGRNVCAQSAPTALV